MTTPLRGYVATWQHGCTWLCQATWATWLYCYVATWLHGHARLHGLLGYMAMSARILYMLYFATWLHGYVATWVHGYGLYIYSLLHWLRDTWPRVHIMVGKGSIIITYLLQNILIG